MNIFTTIQDELYTEYNLNLDMKTLIEILCF